MIHPGDTEPHQFVYYHTIQSNKWFITWYKLLGCWTESNYAIQITESVIMWF